MGEDVVGKIAEGVDIFGDGEVGVVEDIGTRAWLGNDLLEGMGGGEESDVGAAQLLEMACVGLADGEDGVGLEQHGFVATEFAGLGAEVEAFPEAMIGMREGGVVVVFDVVSADKDETMGLPEA